MDSDIKISIDKILNGVPLSEKLHEITNVVDYLENLNQDLKNYRNHSSREYKSKKTLAENIICRIIPYDCFHKNALKYFHEERFARIQNMAITCIKNS